MLCGTRFIFSFLHLNKLFFNTYARVRVSMRTHACVILFIFYYFLFCYVLLHCISFVCHIFVIYGCVFCKAMLIILVAIKIQTLY